MGNVIVFLVYMAPVAGLLGLAGLLEELSERVPFLDMLVNMFIDSMMLNPRDDEDEW